MKGLLKAVFKVYDIIAHIVGHFVLLGAIIGFLGWNIYISFEKNELYLVLIEIIIMLLVIILALYLILKLTRNKKNK